MDRLVLAGLMNGALASLLALVVVAATRAWRNPYFGRIAWLAVILKLVTPPLLFIPVEVAWLESASASVPAEAITLSDEPARGAAELPLVAAGVEGQAAVGLTPTEVAPRAVEVADEPGAVATLLQGVVRTLRSLDLLRTLGVAWLAGSLLLGVLGATRIWRFQRSLSRSQLASPAVAGRAAAIAGRLDLRTLPRIAVVAGRVAPLAWSLGRQATVIVPAALVETLAEDSLDAVLAHELTHLRRRDHWARWLELVAITLYWWCPTTWFARRRVHEAEEQCCDADVLRMFPTLRRGYGRALLETLDLLAGDRSLAPGASGWGTRRSLRRRFEQIAAERRVAPLRSWGRGSCWAAIALLCLLAPTGASSEEPKLEPASAPPTNEPTAAQTDDQAETISFEIEEESLPCTVTLSNGSIIKGMLIDQEGERLVVLSDEKRNDGEKSPAPRDPPAPRKAESFKMWDLRLDECVRLMMENHPSFRISELTNDDGWLTLSRRDATRHSLLDIQRFGEDQVRDVFDCYWELHFAYRDIESRRDGLATALKTWRRVKGRHTVGDGQAQAKDEAQCRNRYFNFRQQVETAQSNLFVVENRLRYLLGLSASDGRLIRPVTPPDMAAHRVDLETAREEAFAKRVDVREQTKRLAEHERWQKAAESLAVNSDAPTIEEKLTQLKARRCQLLTARETAVLKDIQLSVSHQLGQAIRDLDLTYLTTQTNCNQDHAAQDDVAAVEAIYKAGRVSLDLLLQAQQRRAQAASAYHRSVAEYQRAIMRVEYRKGALLEAYGIRVAE